MDVKYSQLLNKAFYFHKNGRFDEAEELYKGLLQINPDDTNVLNLYSMLCLAKGNADIAVDMLSKALVLNSNPIIMSNLAKAYYMVGDVQNSIKFYEEAASLEPTDDIYYSMGISYKQANNYEKAIEAYNKALELNPNNYNVLYNLAVLYKEQKKYDLSLNTAIRAEFINTDDEDIHSLLSSLFELKSNYKKAIIHLKKAHELNPKQYLYVYNQGVLFSKLGENDNAINCHKKVLEYNPKHVESIVNLASLYKSFDKYKTLKYLELAYSLHPKEVLVCLSLAQTYRDLYFNEKSMEILDGLNCAESYSLMAVNLMDLSCYDKALEYYDKALNMDLNGNYLHGKAMALKYLGHINEAKQILEKIENKTVQTITTLGMIYLQEKNFEKGMELYINRSLETKFSSLFDDKIWKKGDNLCGKTVLLYSDCGLGDTIMFARYIPELKKIAKKVIVQTDKELLNLLKQSFSGVEFYPKSEKNITYDVVMPIMNIAYALDIDFNNIPLNEGYLISGKAQISCNKIKVGIFYQGNKHVFRNRSIPFEEIKRLNSDKIQLYSFQLENYENENDTVINLSDKIKDYSDTAKLLKSMDIVVTIDSSVAHCAGALGVKTFLLLPNTAEWRWFNDVNSTPWYKNTRIFKQTSSSDWKSVINRVIEELK